MTLKGLQSRRPIGVKKRAGFGWCYPVTNRLALGTAQLALPYGISNEGNKVRDSEADAILDAAWEGGINTLDTAISYGECEHLLGKIGVGQWQIISKLPKVPETCKDVASWVQDSVAGSIKRLKTSKLHGLLLHHPKQLLSPRGDELYRALVSIQRAGRVEKIGLSIYGSDELEAIWPQYQFDLVQAPFNILDRSLVLSGWLNKLRQAGTEVHVRSVFLQGLLLMDPVSRPKKFNRWQSLWDDWHSWLKDQALTPLQACLSFANSHPEINRVVVGVNSLQQLKDILACDEKSVSIPPESLICKDLNLINPSRWSMF